jgi:type IV pilus assembly protein PilO
MAILEKVDELNNKQRLLILGIVIALVTVGFYYYIYVPGTKNIAAQEGRLAGLQRDLSSLQTIAAKLPEFKATIQQLETQLVEIRKKLPQDREIPGLLESISKAGTESGLQFELFRPRGEVRHEIYSDVPVDITVKGPFQNIIMFLDKIAHLPRIVNVTTFSFTAPHDESGYVFVTGTGMATTYRYNEK